MANSRAAAVFLFLCLIAVAATVTGGCGGKGNPAGTNDDPPEPGDTIYVDPAFSGDEYGTQDNPFDTIAEALAIAGHGDRIALAAGAYGDQSDVEVHHAVEIAGAGSGQTSFTVGFALAADTGTSPVVLESLACASVYTLPDTVSQARCAYEVRSCTVGAITDSLPLVDTLHYRLVDDCDIAGDVYLGGASVKADCEVRNSTIGGRARLVGVSTRAELVLDSCTVGGDASIWTVLISSEQRVQDCTVGGSLTLCGVSTSSTRAVGNTVAGDSLVVAGEAVSACEVTGNTLQNGDLIVRGRSIIAEVTGNTIESGALTFQGRAADVAVQGNTVTRTSAGPGIEVRATTLGRCVSGNTVSLPYEPWSGVDAPHDTLASVGIFVDGTAIEGVRGNVITGGAYGIYARGLSIGGVSGNDVSDSQTGVAVVGLSAAADSNDIHDCVGDGMALHAHPDAGPGQSWLTLEGNTVGDNGGAGVRVYARATLGGAPAALERRLAGSHPDDLVLPSGWYRSDGGNELTGNGDYDLAIEILSADVDTIWARGNAWDHADSLAIGTEDVHDQDDDPLVAKAVYWPAARR